MWPVLQAKIADRRGRVRSFLRREGPCLDGASGDERVRQICEFLRARCMRLDVRPDPREERCPPICALEEPSRWRCENTRLAKNVHDFSDRVRLDFPSDIKA